jgi:hypothetical protein
MTNSQRMRLSAVMISSTIFRTRWCRHPAKI